MEAGAGAGSRGGYRSNGSSALLCVQSVPDLSPVGFLCVPLFLGRERSCEGVDGLLVEPRLVRERSAFEAAAVGRVRVEVGAGVRGWGRATRVVVVTVVVPSSDPIRGFAERAAPFSTRSTRERLALLMRQLVPPCYRWWGEGVCSALLVRERETSPPRLVDPVGRSWCAHATEGGSPSEVGWMSSVSDIPSSSSYKTITTTTTTSGCGVVHTGSFPTGDAPHEVSSIVGCPA